MKYFTFLILLFTLFACAPKVNTPTAAVPADAIQRFVPYCQEGFLSGGKIEFRPIQNVSDEACQSYTLINVTNPISVTTRISGKGIKLNKECVMIDSIETTEDEFERVRCVFTDSLAIINIYLLGEDLIVISEVQTDSRTFYLPPLGVESEKKR